MSKVIRPNGEEIEVGNLRWMVRNIALAERVELITVPEGQGEMVVALSNGNSYFCAFGSETLMRSWAAKHFPASMIYTGAGRLETEQNA